jgi:hypothetical protein
MEKKESTNALAQARIQDDKSKSTRRQSLSSSRRGSNSSGTGHKQRSHIKFLLDTLANDQSIVQDKGINATAEAGKGLRRGRKPGVQKELEELQNDIRKARRASRKGGKKNASKKLLKSDDYERLSKSMSSLKLRSSDNITPVASHFKQKSKGKKGKTLKKDKQKLDVQPSNSNTESSGSNTTENTPAKGDPAANDRVTLKSLPRQKEIKSDDSRSTISQEDSELDDKEVGQRFLLAERVRSLTNNALPTPPASPYWVTEKEKAAIEDSQESTPSNKKKSRKRASKKSPKCSPPYAESRNIDLDHGTPIIAKPGESEYAGAENSSLDLQLPFTVDANEANSNTASNNKSSGKKRDKLTSASVTAGDVVAFDDDGDTVVSDITEGIMISSISSAEISDSFRGKWEPGMGMISESDQLSQSDNKETSQSTGGRSLHLVRRWQSAHDIHSAAKSPKTPIRKGSHTLSDSFRGQLEPEIVMISELDQQLTQSDHEEKSPSTPALTRRWQSARDISSAAKSPKTPIRKESHTVSYSLTGKREPGIGMISESDQLSQSEHTEKSRSTGGRSLHLVRRWQSAHHISSAAKSPKTPIRKESDQQPTKSDHKEKSPSTPALTRRWRSARDISSAAKSPKPSIPKEPHTPSYSLRSKREPGIVMISESDQLTPSDHKKGKSPSTAARSLHLVRRWQSALHISSAVDSPMTPMREGSERGKTRRFEWVKKKLPFVKKR